MNFGSVRLLKEVAEKRLKRTATKKHPECQLRHPGEIGMRGISQRPKKSLKGRRVVHRQERTTRKIVKLKNFLGRRTRRRGRDHKRSNEGRELAQINGSVAGRKEERSISNPFLAGKKLARSSKLHNRRAGNTAGLRLIERGRFFTQTGNTRGARKRPQTGVRGRCEKQKGFASPMKLDKDRMRADQDG